MARRRCNSLCDWFYASRSPQLADRGVAENAGSPTSAARRTLSRHRGSPLDRPPRRSGDDDAPRLSPVLLPASPASAAAFSIATASSPRTSRGPACPRRRAVADAPQLVSSAPMPLRLALFAADSSVSTFRPPIGVKQGISSSRSIKSRPHCRRPHLILNDRDDLLQPSESTSLRDTIRRFIIVNLHLHFLHQKPTLSTDSVSELNGNARRFTIDSKASLMISFPLLLWPFVDFSTTEPSTITRHFRFDTNLLHYTPGPGQPIAFPQKWCGHQCQSRLGTGPTSPLPDLGQSQTPRLNTQCECLQCDPRIRPGRQHPPDTS